MRDSTLMLGTSAIALLLSPQMFAQSFVESNVGGNLAKNREPTEKWTWTAGLGLGATPDYEGGDDYEAVPIPVIQAQKGFKFAKLIGLHATSNLFDHPNWRLGPSLNFRQGYSDVDSNRVDNLTNRGSSLEFGMKGGYEFYVQEDASLNVDVEIQADVSSGHDGWLFTPSIDYSGSLNPSWNLGLGTSLTYANGDYMSHFFSVNRSDAARSGLEEFDADNGFKDAALYASLSWTWTEHWRVHGIAQYRRMMGDAKDSPIVDDEGDKNQYFGALAVTYTWD